MITKFITEVRARFNPFARPARTCRIFVAQFGPAVWPTVRFKNELLPRASAEPSSLKIKFQDGKEMELDTENLSFRDIEFEVDRHSRQLSRQAELKS